MGFKLQELPGTFSGIAYGIAGIAAAIVLVARLSRRPNLDAFPTVGSNGLLGSWGAGFKFLVSGIDIIQEGYEKHQSVPFKVVDKYGCVVILSNRKHLEELQRVPGEELSLMAAINDQLNICYTLGDEIYDTPPYHVMVVRSQLTRNIGTLYDEVRDEIVTAFEEVLYLRSDEWRSVSALEAIQKVVCRSTNRLLVGLPLCRDPDWIDLSIQYAINVVKTGLTIGLFPGFMRPLAARLFTAVAPDSLRARKHLGPIIEERLKRLNECKNEWAEKPNDLISWLIEEVENPQLNVKSLTSLVLGVIFPAVHTTSASFTHALFYLAANPQYVQPLREEVEMIVGKEGWSKVTLGKMRKIDSFLKECQRIEGLSAMSVVRKALKDFTFSDGTFIPKGAIIGVATRCLHHDEKFYKNADVFEPFRFAEIQEVDAGGVSKYQFASTAIEYQPFGHGKHACPGRFLAANNMKTMLAHIVTTYAVKLEDGATHPRSLRFGTAISPSPSAKVLFRRRVHRGTYFFILRL